MQLTRMVRSANISPSTYLINISLQRAVAGRNNVLNRFSGFSCEAETAKAVKNPFAHPHTPLKRGVNENRKCIVSRSFGSSRQSDAQLPLLSLTPCSSWVMVMVQDGKTVLTVFHGPTIRTK